MSELLTLQDLANGHLDVKALGEAVTGDENTIVTTRTGETYPSLSNALNQIDGQISDANDMLVESVTTLFTNGGLPATPFATKALMTASALVDGKYAMVTDDTVNNGLYVKTAGAWVKSTYDPTALANTYTDNAKTQAIADSKAHTNAKFDDIAYITNSIVDAAPPDAAYAIADGYGYSALEVTNEGVVKIGELHTDKLSGSLGVVEDKLSSIGDLLPTGYAWGLVDDYGRMPVGVKDNGSLSASGIDTDNINVKTINGKKVDNIGGGVVIPDLGADISAILSYGQSLSHGSSSGGAVNTTQKYNSVMLSLGMIYSRYPEPVQLATATFVPAVETDDETPMASASNMIHGLLASENNYKYSEYDFKFALCATGRGATGVGGLSKGQAYYDRNTLVMQKFKDLGLASNKVVKNLAWFWSQGESDYSSSTSQADYKFRLNKLITDLSADTKSITGQSEQPQCIGYQTQTHDLITNPVPTIGLAMYELSNERADYHIACPLYQLQQPLHPAAWGYIVIGAYYGVAYKRIIIDKQPWQPLQPKSVENFGKITYVKFHVPVGGLEFDDGLKAFANKGFSCVNGAGSVVAITDVSLSSADTVRIVTASPLDAGGKVQYGFNGGGNLRDKQGDYLEVDANGRIVPLHNWCLIFDILAK